VSSAAREGALGSRGGGSRRRVAELPEIQRARLLAAAVGAFEEYGYACTTVQQITARARVSRRTFYELFENREGCLVALLEDVVGAVEGELGAAGLAGAGWCERVRGGLGVILAFFDREPALARVCVVQALRGGPGVLERREAILARLAVVVDEGRGEGARGVGCSPLTAEGLVGAAFGIVYARLLRGERRPLADLLGELMGMIVLPYLGAAAARRELARPARPAVSVEARASAPRLHGDRDPLRGVQMRLTFRTARALVAIGELPGVSNRVVAERAGIADPGQVSKLLRRLERLGLTVNTGEGHAKGEPNAWRLTALGEGVTGQLSLDGRSRRVAA
jgi:AcrR family transcriptional regulator